MKCVRLTIHQVFSLTMFCRPNICLISHPEDTFSNVSRIASYDSTLRLRAINHEKTKFVILKKLNYPIIPILARSAIIFSFPWILHIYDGSADKSILCNSSCFQVCMLTNLPEIFSSTSNWIHSIQCNHRIMINW